MRTVSAPSILAHLPVRRGHADPLHKQIYDGMRRAILDGLLRPGQRIPSTRELARTSASLGCRCSPHLINCGTKGIWSAELARGPS